MLHVRGDTQIFVSGFEGSETVITCHSVSGKSEREQKMRNRKGKNTECGIVTS
jgi:hypothetical protein